MPFQIHAYGLGQPSFIYSRTSLSEGDLFDLADFAAARVRNIVGASPRGSMTAQATRQVSDAYGQLAAAILLRDGLDFLMSHAAHGSSLRITALSRLPICSGLRWAPPIGSRTTLSTSFSSRSRFAVRPSCSAASLALRASFHRIEAQPSGVITE